MPGDLQSKDIFASVLESVRAANDALIGTGVLPSGIDQSRVLVEPPRDAAHGDMATNAAMVLAKDAGKKVLLFSHHQPFSLLDSQGPNLVAPLSSVLATGQIHGWYWGHEHRCVLYDQHASR